MDAVVEPTKLNEDVSREAHPCPRCDESVVQSAAIQTHQFAEPICRCARCGTRFIWADGEVVADETARPQGDDELTHAIEVELQQTLARRWNLVDQPAIRSYLDGLTHRLMPHLTVAPPAPRVTLCDDTEFWVMAMPSGAVLLSTGLLGSLADEAELAFLLAHEFSHAASRDVALRMVQLGVDSLSRGDGNDTENGWLAAADDMIGLGFGRDRERAADEDGFRVLAGCGYDLRSVGRFFERLGEQIDDHDERVARYAVAHPPVGERLRALDAFQTRRPGIGVGRINREPFRRIVVAATREPCWERLDAVRGADPQKGTVPPRRRFRGLLWVAAIATVGLLLWLGFVSLSP